MTARTRCGPLRSVGPSDIPCLTFFIDLLELLDMGISAINVRNQFKGKVKEIIRGPVVSEVDVETPFGIVTSVITTRSVDELELAVGSEVVALVKSTEVSIARL
jgi:molybdopterin-binding protein